MDPRPPGTAKHDARSTPERVADAITKAILKRRVKVGQRLVEADLMRELGVGRSTVREALRLLSAHGVVELAPHRGAVVRALSREDASELLGVIEVLCGLAARLAAQRLDHGAQRRRFEAAARALVEPRGDAELNRLPDARAAYYRDVRGRRQSELDRALPQPRVHLFRTQFYDYLTRADLRAMVAEYRGITEAILAGDAALAEKRMRRHIVKTGERTLPRLGAPGAG
ncbi:MAG: GntR family transcriptional regulator [Burkholderiaceae bacterium]